MRSWRSKFPIGEEKIFALRTLGLVNSRITRELERCGHVLARFLVMSALQPLSWSKLATGRAWQLKG